MELIRAAAVQSGVDPRWTPDEWINHLRWQLTNCRENRVDLAVFPAWSGVYQDSYPRGFPEEAQSTLVHLLGGLAREARLYLVVGMVPLRCLDGIKLRGFLLAPSGDLLGTQDQLCPPPGFIPGRELAVFQSAIGRLGIIQGADSSLPEIGRILALQGADLYCAPQGFQAPYNSWRQAAGLWQAVQANQVSGVEACLVGEFRGLPYAGCSRVLGTVEMTPDGTGVLAQAATLTQTEIVQGEVDFNALARARKLFPVFTQFNTDLYRRRLAGAYRALRTATSRANPGGALPAGTEPSADRNRREVERA